MTDTPHIRIRSLKILLRKVLVYQHMSADMHAEADHVSSDPARTPSGHCSRLMRRLCLSMEKRYAHLRETQDG